MNLSSLKASLSSLVRGHDFDTREERNARNLILSGAWLGFIDGGIVTYLSVWLVRLGATPALMGLLASLPQFVNMLVVLPAGAYVERRKDHVAVANRVALVHRSGYLLIAALPFFLAPAQTPLIAILLWSALAIPGAAFFPALMAVIQKAVPPQMRARVNASRWALYSVVGALAIPAVGAMIDHVPFPVGYQIAFAISFFGSLPSLFFFRRIILSPFEAASSGSAERRPLRTRMADFLRPFLQSRAFVRYNVAVAAFRVALSMPAGLFSIYWVDYLGATDTQVGIRGSVAYLSLVVGYWGWAKVANRIGHRWLLFCAACIGFYPIMTGLSPSVGWLIPAAVIWGIFVAAIDIGIIDMLLLSCPEGRQPSFSAVSNMLASIEVMIGPLAGAALASLIGVAEALVVAGTLQLASSVFFLLLPNHEQELAAHKQPAPQT
jgi:MFS family permease